MNILFIKHGEDIDDIEDRLGGWNDASLSPKGIEEAKIKLPIIKQIGIQFQTIIKSPFKRTLETAQVLAEELDLPIIEEEYLKEVNAYGIFTGMLKSEVYRKYPEFKSDKYKGPDGLQYIEGAETWEGFRSRTEKIPEKLKSITDQNAIVVTHGGIMRRILDLLNRKPIGSINWTNCYILIELTGEGIKYISSSEIEFS